LEEQETARALLISPESYVPYLSYVVKAFDLSCYFAALKILKFWIDHTGAPSGDAVCVMRTNFACTGANVMIVVAPLPCPSATLFHDAPSIETSTL
jgi:hypothetical protein